MTTKKQQDRIDYFKRAMILVHNRNVRQAYGTDGEEEAGLTAAALRKAFDIEMGDSLFLILGKLMGFYLGTNRSPAIAALPMRWAVTAEQYRPQLVLVSRPTQRRLRLDGKYDGNRELHIPHFDFNKIERLRLPDYTIGQYCATYLLKDRSTILVYCDTRENARKLCAAMAEYTLPNKRLSGTIDDNITDGKRRKPLKSHGVKMSFWRGIYYKFGQTGDRPDYIYNLRTR